MADDDEWIQVNLRLRRRDLASVDERRQRVGRSRNSWIESAIRWALDQPERTVTITRRTEERM
jgi:hypothetical protein